MNITLIGMPGAGKSYVGERLAEKTGFTFFEVDTLLQEEYGMPLQKVLDTLGADVFLDVEAARLIENCKEKDRIVVSPGGSIIYREAAMEFLKKFSTIFYLKVPVDVIRERIGEAPRGIVNPNGKRLEELFEERMQLYEKWADHTIDGTEGAETVVDQIIKTGIK
jgi:shikimate kinase